MPHIPLSIDLPGITGLMAFKPATGRPLAALMHQLLRGDSPLTPVERELIAAHVSRLNSCDFCARSHAATARHLDTHAAGPVVDPDGDRRMPALLDLAAAVVDGGHAVTDDLVAAARAAGADDEEIHDTVLIAAAFCMVNRYVDGLATIAPDDDASYDRMGMRMASTGYQR
jgi:uncharacterized peroxidase-related enzyme